MSQDLAHGVIVTLVGSLLVKSLNPVPSPSVVPLHWAQGQGHGPRLLQQSISSLRVHATVTAAAQAAEFLFLLSLNSGSASLQ